MQKKVLVVLAVLLISSACVGFNLRNNPAEASNFEDPVHDFENSVQNVQFSHPMILPPYGRTVTVDKVLFKIQIYSEAKNAEERLQDFNLGIQKLKDLTDTSIEIDFDGYHIQGIEGDRWRVSEIGVRYGLDTSSILAQLSVNLASNNLDTIDALIILTDALSTLDMPKTLKMDLQVVEPNMGDLERFRSEIIAQVYQELESVQRTNNEFAHFEVSGLYDSLKVIQLNDTEYYLYLEPMIRVVEF